MSKHSSSTSSAEKALLAMETIAEARHGATLTELSQRLGCHRSTTLRLLSTLMDRGYVERHAAGQYVLGLRIVTLAYTKLDEMEVRQRARPYLVELAELSDETINIALLDGIEIVYVDRLQGRNPIRLNTPVGARAPAWCTAIGKVLLAELDPGELHARLGATTLPAFTKRTINDVDQFVPHLDVVRRQGYALNDGEHREDGRCIAAPVRDHTGKAVAGLSITAPLFRMSDERIEELLPYLRSAARNLSNELGYVKHAYMDTPARFQGDGA